MPFRLLVHYLWLRLLTSRARVLYPVALLDHQSWRRSQDKLATLRKGTAIPHIRRQSRVGVLRGNNLRTLQIGFDFCKSR
jgi:hypothetical protein